MDGGCKGGPPYPLFAWAKRKPCLYNFFPNVSLRKAESSEAIPEESLEMMEITEIKPVKSVYSVVYKKIHSELSGLS